VSVSLQAGTADVSIGIGDPFDVSPRMGARAMYRPTVERRLRRDFANRNSLNRLNARLSQLKGSEKQDGRTPPVGNCERTLAADGLWINDAAKP